MTSGAAAVLVSIGNSRTAFAALLGDGRLADIRREATPGFEAAALPPGREPVHLISVVEPAAAEAVSALRRAGRAVTWWGREQPIPVRHPYEPPASPGADRLVAAFAAFRRVGGECIVVDAGTALTVDLVGADGAFLGGAIAPGFAALAAGLRAQVPALPPCGGLDDDPIVFPARSSADAVTFGVQSAFVGAVRVLVGNACANSGRMPVVVTGGDAEHAALALMGYNPVIAGELVLEGLAALAALP